MRGKQVTAGNTTLSKRNIPAYAGKTPWTLITKNNHSEHPRVCGENFQEPGKTRPDTGTSPRMRGKLGRARTRQRCARNIPAYAGKTQGVTQRTFAPEEHPRVCGENKPKPPWNPRPRGTSPRMRGKPILKEIAHKLGRNIPAYAGKTMWTLCPSMVAEEHPRVCGENQAPVIGLY